MSRVGRRIMESLPAEILLRIGLFALFCYMETLPPFVRYTTAEELVRDHKYPRHDSYVPPEVLWALVVAVPLLYFAVGYLATGDKDDIIPGLLAVTLALGINGVFTVTIKLMAGRLRPDFFYRCFPDGVMTQDLVCTGDARTVADGRMSFPSGHSSFMFCSLGSVAVWTYARACAGCARGSGAALTCCLLPLHAALVVAMTRSCDYHHFWQDIVAGASLGLGCAYVSYRQYYPPPWSIGAGLARASRTPSPATSPPDGSEGRPLLNVSD